MLGGVDGLAAVEPAHDLDHGVRADQAADMGRLDAGHHGAHAMSSSDSVSERVY